MKEKTTITLKPKTKQRLDAQVETKGETYDQIVNRLIEERKFQKRAMPILEKAKRIMGKHEKIGSNWAEVEESFRELLALVDDFLEELKRR